MVYQYKTGYFNKVPAQVAGEEINRLYEEGKSSPKDIVDASRPESAPLHPAFEWNDSVAAELYRQDQARCLIRQIVTIQEVENDEPIQARAYFKLDSEESIYEPTIVIMNDADKRQQLLDLAKRELKQFKIKYAVLKELAKVFEAIDEIVSDQEAT